MPTQKEIAQHLGMSQQAVSQQLAALGVDWRNTPMDSIRRVYIKRLRAMGQNHRSEDGYDLANERALTEQVDRELKQINLAEKKEQVVNLEQLRPALIEMVAVFRRELMAADAVLKSSIDELYGVDIDIQSINQYTFQALSQLAPYDVASEFQNVGQTDPDGGIKTQTGEQTGEQIEDEIYKT